VPWVCAKNIIIDDENPIFVLHLRGSVLHFYRRNCGGRVNRTDETNTAELETVDVSIEKVLAEWLPLSL
jgi:hypothetical protein